MELEFRRLILPAEAETLVDWLSNEKWPFHSTSQVSQARVHELVNEGYYSEPNCQTFWIVHKENQNRVGLIRLFDLEDIEDGSPLFDLRILKQYRSQGIGKKAVKWITQYFFETWPNLQRVEGTTRIDNLSMRSLFKKCGYVKEGHYRQAWPTSDGQKLDTVHYSILKQDWVSGIPTLVSWNE